MAFLAARITGPIPKAAAQGKAIKELLKVWSPEECEACFETLMREAWRKGRVTWLTVQSNIGFRKSWLSRPATQSAASDPWAGQPISEDEMQWLKSR